MRGASRTGVDLAFDDRITSHMSAGMALYVRKLRQYVPQVAPDLRLAFVGAGDNFDLAEQLGLPLAIARLRPRLVHIPTPFVPIVVPARFVLTIHDLIDLHYPQFGKRKVGPYYRRIVAPVARRARAVITDDAATVADLERFLRIDPARVRVVPLGVDLEPPHAVGAAPERPYFLYVGNAREHKNLATLVRAWELLPPGLPADLLLTGALPAAANLPHRAAGCVRYVGTCSDAELSALYRGASAYVHPALREGFGLPMLEAMRAGTPVIAAREALPAVLAPYAHAFGARDAAALSAIMTRALAEPEPFWAAAAAAHTATRELTWEATARATVVVYREFLA